MGDTFDAIIELMSEMTKLTRVLTSHGNFGDVQDEIVKRANEINDEMEKCYVLFKKDCILFVDICTKSQVGNMELQDELLVVKKELARLKEDERIASEKAKMVEERLAKDCEEQSRMTKEKSEMILELNVDVTNLKKQVLEKDEMLNKCRERLKRMEVEVAQKKQEVNDLKQQNSAAYQSIEKRLKNQVLLESNQMLNACKERLGLLEAKVLQKEQELHDFKHQKIVAYQINEENLKDQVLERDQMLSTCKEILRLLEVKVLEREQEVHDLKHQKLAADQIIEDLTRKQTEADQRVEELRRQRMEASERTEKFKKLYLYIERDKLKSDEELKDIKEKQLEMISELNAKITNSKNQVLEKDEMLNKCRERLKCMEVEVEQKEQEVNDLKHQKSVANQVMEETLENHILESGQLLNKCGKKLKCLEAKVLQQEQELHDLKHKKFESFQISNEKLKNQVLEKDQMLNAFEKKMKIMEVKVVQKEQEVHVLNHQKLAAYQVIRNLTHKQTEADQKEEELRRQNVEASENAEKLKQLLLAVERDKLKSDEELKNIQKQQLEANINLKKLSLEHLVALQAVEEFKEWTLQADESFEVNKERSEGSVRIKNVEKGLIRDLKIKVLELAKSVSKEAVDVSSPIPKGGRELLRTCTGINEGGENDDDSLDQAGSRFHSSPPQVETSCSADLEKGTGKSHCSGILAEDTVEVANRDDEARPGESEYNSNLQVSLAPRRKRSSLGNTDGNLPNKTQKKEPTHEPSQENDESLGIKSNTPNPASDSQIRIWTSSSDSEDESCSDSDMNDVRIVRFENLCKAWKSESDILKDFQQDVELCMYAVCVLYRWKIRESESPAYSDVEVSHFDVMGGCSLAKYLINGDPVCRLGKFLSEIEVERPDGLVQCRKIATAYSEKLFSNGNDLFSNDDNLLSSSSLL